ncbi:uncharacterized protein PAN0_006d3008 [Moesziomyces antarcticus]|uniref:Uncharacterized protein n=2 Tax=Pseudozyma antarctica TaxID=84753 RepID=A0A081CDP7_PSEA2|nr:uncharacterized protein PAN0_006d3008 [Moesziomyces antarcticus]GAK64793.1 conserved hypothetical protein [Moesziomyces antarcticus]SPO45784.1 related to conserved hypothetical Ustilaginaceae-specific protein [Moesziomyces antarcticus]
MDFRIPHNSITASDGKAAPSTPRRAHAQPSEEIVAQALVSPDRSKARACASSLASLGAWRELCFLHEEISRDIRLRDNYNKRHLRTLVEIALEEAKEIVEIMPRLRDALIPRGYALDTSHSLALQSAFVAAYRDVGAQLEPLAPDHALAYVLLKLPRFLQLPSRDPEVRETNTQLANQFGRDYHGDAPERFLDFVIDLDRSYDALTQGDKQPYYRGTPIVQSSGTGKTRMVLQLRSYAPLLYVCIRDHFADNNAKAGYPFPDEGVRDYFDPVAVDDSYMIQVTCFLAAWFQVLAEALASQHAQTSNSCSDKIAQLKFAYLWKLNALDEPNGINSARNDFFDRVSKAASAVFGIARVDHRTRLTRIRHLLREEEEKQQRSQHAPGHIASSSAWRLEREKLLNVIMEEQLAGPLAALSEQLQDVLLHLSRLHPGRPNPPPVLVAFDECVLLDRDREGGETQLDCLRRVWNFLGNLRNNDGAGSARFWLVLMSTSSSAAQLVEYVGAGPSARRKESAPLPTFVGLNLDVLASQDAINVTCAAQVAELHHMVKYGRPLWNSLVGFDDFWHSARMKLLGGDDFFAPQEVMQCYSVLASRLALTLLPAQSSDFATLNLQKTNAQRAVDRHMRIVDDIGQDGSMRVISPSEPVLAITAALIMQPMEEVDTEVDGPLRGQGSTMYARILSEFHTSCLHNKALPLFKGVYGELAARIILLAAWDAAKRDRIVGVWRQDRLRSASSAERLKRYAAMLGEPEPVERFVAGLADPNEVDTERLSQRVQQVKEAAGSAEAWVHFSHFDVLPEPIAHISTDYLWFCWKRGVALQMAHVQRGIDGIIPVFLGDLKQAFDDEKEAAKQMSYIAWEAKHRLEAQPSSHTASPGHLAGPLLKHTIKSGLSGGALTKRGMLTVLMDLSATTTFLKTQTQRPIIEPLSADSVRLNVRGARDATCLPCLDRLGIRDVLNRLLGTTMQQARNSLNQVGNPIWNHEHHPDRHKAAPSEEQMQID